MADIAQKADLIRHAEHGLDVREALASGIEDINEETENTTARQGQVEQDFTNIKTSEQSRIAAENTRVANEETRVTNENTRIESENTRIANEDTRITNETARQQVINALKVCELYDNNKPYVMYNKVTYQGSTYQCIVENVQGVTPGTDNTNWLLIAIKGQDGTGGDMFKATYDTDNNGIVDDAEKLGGQLPAYYSKQEDFTSHLADNIQQFADLNDLINNLSTNDVEARREILDIKLKLDENDVMSFLSKTGIGFYDLFKNTENIDTTNSTVNIVNTDAVFTGEQLLKFLEQQFDSFKTVELAVYDLERQSINVDTDANNSNTIETTVSPDSITVGDKFYFNGEIYIVNNVQLEG